MLFVLLGCTPTAPTLVPPEPSPPAPVVAPRPSFVSVALDPLALEPSREVLDRAMTVRVGEVNVQGQAKPLLFDRIITPPDFGTLYDAAGKPIGGDTPRVCDADFNAFFGDVMLTHFECSPGGINRSVLEGITVKETRPLDFAPFGGSQHHCAGEATPWGTLLSSEEYEPDAYLVETFLAKSPQAPLAEWPEPLRYHDYENSTAYYPQDGVTWRPLRPYDIGWMPEITTEGAVVKHFAMGRFSHELGIIMPDRKTVYLSDDASYGGVFRFVADKADTLSAGTLYALKLEPGTGLARTVRWIDLGRASNAEINRDLRFGDLFDRTALPCADGFTALQNNGIPECVRLKPDMALQASRLETRRYAELLGATTEFSKGEGLAYDTAQNRVYLSVSAFKSGMLGGGDISVEKNRCGAIVSLALDDAYAATAMSVLYAGVEAEEIGIETCRDMANPDNIAMLETKGLARGGVPGHLIIAEDTGLRPNPRLWALDLAIPDALPVAIAVGPLGAEFSGLAVWDRNGAQHLGVTLQHVGAGYDMKQMPAPYGKAATPSGSWLGLISGW